MADHFTSLLASSNLDVKVPQSPLSPPLEISQILNASSRRTLFFGTHELSQKMLIIDETVSLFIIFRLPVDEMDLSQLNSFLKETILAIEVAITDTPRQSDPDAKREKFDGITVYTATVSETSEAVKELIEGQWFVAWNVCVPISYIW